jgi:hypothetical protein
VRSTEQARKSEARNQESKNQGLLPPEGSGGRKDASEKLSQACKERAGVGDRPSVPPSSTGGEESAKSIVANFT